ncbi:MAG TPA: hypothetical protein VMR14_16170 [Streptosporangiaceae bacterium]|nr:hypothetical protein [Streptosporangiaceae bacterium]
MITENELRAAAATIGDMPAADVERRLRQLKDRRRACTSLAELAHLAEQDLAELEQAAYHLARRCDDEGDLAAAARWYRVAAANDFADASLELAKVLDRLAAGQRNYPAAPGSDRTELDLVSDAARWYGAAYAAGHPESADLLDDLIARHDPRRARESRAPAGHLQPRPCDPCPLGGLTEVMRCQLTVASAHVGTCRSCQQELLAHGGILPAIGRNTVRSADRPPATALAAEPPS